MYTLQLEKNYKCLPRATIPSGINEKRHCIPLIATHSYYPLDML